MGQALYRTHRPKKLSEIVGQEHITTALGNALKKGTISHAYLFTGPRGTGKTTTARILAHEINQLPYDEDRQHLDIIEIDAASNRRIDEIRDLRDKVYIAPSSAKFKVYIIDEVHMLTKEAFNALLKTLEEPPAHVVFILATTEMHKLPETIVSRTQRYAFKPVDKVQVAAHLRSIASAEKIDISDEALELIAVHGEGSFRDSISLLDQIRNTTGKIELTNVQAVLGIAPLERINGLMQALQQADSAEIINALRAMHEQGYEPAQIAKQISGVLRQSIITNQSTLPHDTALRLLTQLVQVPTSADPLILLEIALLDAALIGRIQQPNDTPAKVPSNKVMSEDVRTKPTIQVAPKRPAVQKPAVETSAKEDERAVEKSAESAALIAQAATKNSDSPTNEDTPLEVSADSDMVLTEEAWELILNAIKTKYNTLYSVAKTAEPHFEPGKVTLEFSFPFHQKRLNEARNKQKVSEVIRGVTGSDIEIVCILGTGRQLQTAATLPSADGEIVHNASPEIADPFADTTKTTTPPSPVDAISNIFGSAELLES